MSQPYEPEPRPPAGPGVGVTLDWSMWCDRHLAPYRPQWPHGAALAMVRLFDAAVHMPAVTDWCKGDANRITEALHRFSPLCCFIPHEALLKIYDETVPLYGHPG